MHSQTFNAVAVLLLATRSNGHKQKGDACLALSKALPGQVSFPNSTLYAIENNYWSQRQAALEPSCFVAPSKTADVSTAIKILTSLDQPFSVKGGGHAAFPGASNVEDGVTIDLFRLTEMTISADRKTVSVGAGNRWINVSETLDPLGLAVVGGRVSDVGVGGLILGGGISYFSGRYGWACDNVRNYEVVLSSGKIVNASPAANRDLYWALRGGAGTNFGVVTRFDLASFEQGDLWHRSLIFPGQLNTTLIPIFHNLTVNGLPSDPAAHTYFLLTYLEQLGGFAVLTSQFHSTPPPSLPAQEFIPSIFSPFNAVAQAAIVNTTTIANISTVSQSISQPSGSQQIWMNVAVSVASPSASQLLIDIVPLWQSYVANLLSQVPSSNGTQLLTPYLIFQPMSSNILTAMQVAGGNTLGLDVKRGPRMIVQLSVTWSDAGLNRLVEKKTKELIDDINKLAKRRNLDDGFVYMNYAEPSQDVFSSYGRENKDRLKRVARKYDPTEELKRLWRGYFKLG
ncbi:hypothetical protein QBC37DRAFT_45377 [Rhypophila decipiens]|uniref:FAD-binding PCMH-type domain-containing protein n=1 Tax=Rhypophila decipiens TaxID=261697 RepID=A0AAN6XZI1_9PEZI|nr:hypothetical protein QBC37DRAFT_45377 [Rhypophila decipiens]